MKSTRKDALSAVMLITFWREQDQVWRFRVEDIKKRQKHGFATFAELVSFLESKTVDEQREPILSTGTGTRVLSEFAQPQRSGSDTEGLPTLTARQKEVLALVAQGASNREIAQTLTITERTAKYHISQILERCKLHNRYQLAHYARQQGLIGDEFEGG